MKRLVLYITLVFVGLAFGAKADSLNVMDAAGKKQGYWLIKNENGRFEGYAEGAKVEEGKYKDDKKIGKWKRYFANGNVKSIIEFKNNSPYGYAIIYHSNGKIMEEGLWQNNRWVGPYKLYYDNGEVQQEFNFNSSGKREGEQKYYHPNGELMIVGNWNNGNEAGVVKEYYDDGTLKSQKTFNNGLMDQNSVISYPPKDPNAMASKESAPLIVEAPKGVAATTQKVDLAAAKPNEALGVFTGEGYWKLFNKNKQVSQDGVFKKYKMQDGKVYHYNEDGLLKRIAVYKNGSYVGDDVLPDEK